MPLRIAAILGFLAVALGAFGAHGLQRHLAELEPAQAARQLDWWRTASHYHLAHAVVLLALALSTYRRPWAEGCMIAGITIFSGTLYIMGATGIRWLGAITPIGGTLLLIGWLLLACGKKS